MYWLEANIRTADNKRPRLSRAYTVRTLSVICFVKLTLSTAFNFFNIFLSIQLFLLKTTLMGRKTNSVSLRLKTTNRDYNNCWYGDILYAENFSKSLQVENYLSQTLKTIGMPCPQASVIGAFKKTNLLVCYLDPKKRKELLEKSSRGVSRVFPSYQSKKNNTKAVFPSSQIKHSKALLKPLEVVLEGSSGNFSSPYKGDRALFVWPKQTNSYRIKKKASRQVDAMTLAPKKRHDLPEQKGHLVTCYQEVFLRENTFFYTTQRTDKNDFIVKNIKQQISKRFSKTTPHQEFIYRGSIGLEFVESSYSPGSDAGIESKSKVDDIAVLTEKHQLNNYQNGFKALACFSKSYLITSFFSLKNAFFVKKEKKLNSFYRENFPLEHYKRKNFENSNNTSIEQKSLSDFFHSDRKYTPLICAFNKNLIVFGKKNLSYSFYTNPFSCLSELICSIPSNKKHYVKSVFLEKKESYSAQKQGQGQKKTCSLTSLYGFYNGFSHLFDNFVSLSFYKSTNELSCALFLADTVSYLLEKKVLFRSIKRQLLLGLSQSKSAFSMKELTKIFSCPGDRVGTLENKKKVTGIRISCSGRVGGRSKKAQRSRKDTFMWGETGLHVFSSRLDFYKTHAETPFGVVGVQVWVCTK